jgi:hypothetical protein
LRSHARVLLAVAALAALAALTAIPTAAIAGPPTISPDPVADPAISKAHLTGTVTIDGEGDGGSLTWVMFQYCRPQSPGECTETTGSWELGPEQFTKQFPAGTSAEAHEEDLTGLKANTEYVVRMIAYPEAGGEFFSPEGGYQAFTTDPAPTAPVPTLTTATPGYVSIHLEGSVDPEGGNDNGGEPLPIHWAFEVSTSGDPGTWSANGAEGDITGAEAGESNPIAISSDLGSLAPGTTYFYRLRVTYGGLEVIEGGGSSVETSPVAKPAIVFDPVSAITGDSAHLSGEVDPGGSDPAFTTNCRFEYIRDIDYQPRNEVRQVKLLGSSGTRVWYYRNGAEQTPPLPYNVSAPVLQAALEALPEIGTGNISVSGGPGDATGSTPYIFTFTGAFAGTDMWQSITVDSPSTDTTLVEGYPGGYDYGTPIPCDPATLEGSGSQEVEADLADLQPNTLYHVRLVANNAAGASIEQSTFTTAAVPPTVAAATVGAVSDTAARLTASVDANNSPTDVSFEYATEADFSDALTAPSGEGTELSGNGELAFADLTGLEPDTEYFWRVGAENPEGTDADVAEVPFKTWPAAGPDQGGVGVEGRRQIELISDPKASNAVNRAALSASGDRVLYTVLAGSDQASYSDQGEMLADRTATGWKIRNALPPASAFQQDNAKIQGYSADFTRFAVRATSHFPASGPGTVDTGLWEPDTGKLTRWASGTPQDANASSTMIFPESGNRLLWDFEATSGDQMLLYELAGENPVEVSLLPDESSPPCGVGSIAFGHIITNNAIGTQNWISEDGERFVFQTPTGNDCGAPQQLYMREGGVDGTTIRISPPAVAGPEQGAKFIQATPDMSVIFFLTAARIDPVDLNQTNDLYRYTVGGAAECVTCVVPQADINSNIHPASESTLAVSENGERAYFASERVLAPAAAGVNGLKVYVWRDESPDSIGYVAPFPGSWSFKTTSSSFSSATTPNGRVLLFHSSLKSMDQLTASTNGGVEQAYRYDDRSRSLTCLSCPSATGLAVGMRTAIGSPALFSLARGSTLTPAGDTYFFETKQALVDEDLNNNREDLYEWRRGQLALITRGAAFSAPVQFNEEVAPFATTADAGTVLFKSVENQVSGLAPRSSRLYVARVGGGFPTVTPPTPCTGEGCRSAPTPKPADSGPITPNFSGPGNTKTQPKCPKGKVRKNGRCVKKKGKGSGKQGSKSKGKSKNRINRSLEGGK